MARKLWSMLERSNSIRGATGILVVTLFLSNVLGVVRDHFLAQKIPTDRLDTYYAAFRWPDLIFNTVVLGAVSAAFIPVFTSLRAQGKTDRAWAVANSVLTLIGLLTVVSALLLVVFMPYLMPWLVKGFSADKLSGTVKLAQWLMLSPIFFGFSYVFSGVLNAAKRFLITSLAPLVYNTAIILTTIFLADRFLVEGVVIGVLIGALLHFLIQVPIGRQLGWPITWRLNLADDDFKKVIRLMIPRSIGLGAMQGLLFVFTLIAARLEPGSVAIYSLADNIQTMPTVVFGASIAGALFPTLAERFALSDDERFRSYLSRGLTRLMMILLPMAAGLYLLRVQVVRLVLGSGFFGWPETIAAARSLGMFCLGLVFSGATFLMVRAFYARHDTRLPTIITVVTAIVTVALAPLTTHLPLAGRPLGVAGLALAFSIGSMIQSLLLYLVLSRRIRLNHRAIFSFGLKILIATVGMSLAIQVVKYIIGSLFDLRQAVEVLTQLVLAAGVGGVVYTVIMRALGFDLIHELSIGELLLKRFNHHDAKLESKSS